MLQPRCKSHIDAAMRRALGLLLLASCGAVQLSVPVDDAGPSGDAGVSTDAGLAAPDAGEPDAGSFEVDAGDPCGEHGTFHINHCDCNVGFREIALRCEPIPACEADAFEPNDSLALATSLDGGVASGRLCSSDRDFFLFNAQSGTQLEVRLQFLHSDGNLDLALYEPGRDPRFASPVARADSNTDDEFISHRTRRTGDFLILVSGRGSGTQAPYHLSITTR
jgi:hypothetical protein